MTVRFKVRWLLALVVAGLLTLFVLRVLPFISLTWLDAHQRLLLSYRAAHPVGMAAIFVVFYIAYAGMALPGAEVLAIAAGALFGLVEGTVLVSFASSIGATLAFLLSRFLLRDMVRARFAVLWNMVSRGIEKEGAFYLFALRLIPIIPFFVVDLLMGLTTLRTFTFYWVSQIGMLPATIAYVNAGLQLGRVRAMSEILGPRVLLSFAVLGVLPLAARYSVGALRRRAHRQNG